MATPQRSHICESFISSLAKAMNRLIKPARRILVGMEPLSAFQGQKNLTPAHKILFTG